MSLLANSNAIEIGGYQISRSVRIRASATPYFDRTPASTSGNNTWTFSCWVKRGSDIGSTSTQESIMGAGDGGGAPARYDVFGFYNDTIQFFTFNGSAASIYTTAVFRDPSAWYHLVCRYDDTQATASNRVRIYVNGVLQTLNSPTYPNQNYGSNFNTTYLQRIAANTIATNRGIDGYLAEVIMVSGQSLDPSSFGQTDTITGSWVAKKYTGSYGTNGFFLTFADNSAATSTTIGKDYSGNGNNWTPNNISVTAGSTYDSMLDVPSGNGYADGGNGRGNYAVLNPLNQNSTGVTLANGNLDVTRSSTSNGQVWSTMGMTSGKWYAEVTAGDITELFIGIANGNMVGANRYLGQDSNTWAYYNNGQKVNSATYTNYGNSYANGDVIGIAFDADIGSLYFYKNGTVQNSGTAAFTGLTSSPYFFACSVESSTTANSWNFGQRPFSYAVPSGYSALNTTNLSDPTVKDGGNYFNTILYNGNGNTGQTVTGVGFQPDFLWLKNRNQAGGYYHCLFDSVRGAGYRLKSNATDAEANATAIMSAFTSDGFTFPAGQGNTIENDSAGNYVAWNWKANGTGVSNTAGSITSTVSANTTSGFSVVTYTGTGVAATIGHGLGVAPRMYIVRRRNGVSSWRVYHAAMDASPQTAFMYLELTNAKVTGSALWNSIAPTSTTFSVGTDPDVNTNTNTYVAYCFAAIPGYSAFGSYTGNGSTDGPFVYCGFRPRFVIIKNTAAANWVMFDSARSQYNDGPSAMPVLYPNAAYVEDGAYPATPMDFLSNGFKLRISNAGYNLNDSGATFIYAAFAEVPLKFSNAR